MLEKILNHPEKIAVSKIHEKFGPVVDIKIPGKEGVRFTADGKMIGFLEP